MKGTRTGPPPDGAAAADVGVTYTVAGAMAGAVTVTVERGALLVGADVS
jgi:hypothetical protein